MPSADSVPSILSRVGTAYTIARITSAPGPNAWTPGAPTTLYYGMRAHQGRLTQREIVGDIKQGDIKLTCEPALALPARGDLVAMGVHSALTHGSAQWMRVIDLSLTYQSDKLAVVRLYVRR